MSRQQSCSISALSLPYRLRKRFSSGLRPCWLFLAVRFARHHSGPACPVRVSFASCVLLSAPSPCERLSRLGVLWADLTPGGSSACLLFLSAQLTCPGLVADVA